MIRVYGCFQGCAVSKDMRHYRGGLLTNVALLENVVQSSSKNGAICLHGLHQEAVKSTTRGSPLLADDCRIESGARSLAQQVIANNRTNGVETRLVG
jgi:hypothetical protein